MLWEIEVGPLEKKEARDRRDKGGFLPMSLYVDAKSIFAAITAVFIKPPADKSLLVHVQYIRELLDYCILKAIVWIDTRDMGSDGLTKGAVARDLLHEIMGGVAALKHLCELWCSKAMTTGETAQVKAECDFVRMSSLPGSHVRKVTGSPHLSVVSRPSCCC